MFNGFFCDNFGDCLSCKRRSLSSTPKPTGTPRPPCNYSPRICTNRDQCCVVSCSNINDSTLVHIFNLGFRSGNFKNEMRHMLYLRIILPLSLLVFWVTADHKNFSATTNNVTFLTNAFCRRTNAHNMKIISLKTLLEMLKCR